ncbi:hypothetical protein MKW92_041148 [Papaver armeniacum]|nr:hypothetical protein MKW92_041148 [Papaver armeniacum]
MLRQIEKECLDDYEGKVDEVAAWKEELLKLVALIELKIRRELRALGEGNVYLPKSTETIQKRLDYATIQLCEIEDETGQEFVIEFESQPNELQEKVSCFTQSMI